LNNERRKKMSKSIGKILMVLSFCLLASAVFEPSLADGGETGMVSVSDAALAVDVIVQIDEKTRLITLKRESGEEYSFTAGKEVKNFDQLKRGDRVIIEHYSGFAIALEPQGRGLEEKAVEIKAQRAKAGEKPGGMVSATYYVKAVVAEVDVEESIVVLEGPDHLLALKTGSQVDLASVEVGQKVEALYIEAYAISVKPAPKVSGKITMESKNIAFGIGYSWGKGVFTMHDGTTHDFSVRGLSVVDVGVTRFEAAGEVFNLVEAKDLEGVFVAGEAGATLVGGGSYIILRNRNGVVMKLKSSQTGVRLSLSGEGIKVKLR
jgi:hypothetical protein